MLVAALNTIMAHPRTDGKTLELTRFLHSRLGVRFSKATAIRALGWAKGGSQFEYTNACISFHYHMSLVESALTGAGYRFTEGISPVTYTVHGPKARLVTIQNSNRSEAPATSVISSSQSWR